jgi:hypothetical protein
VRLAVVLVLVLATAVPARAGDVRHLARPDLFITVPLEPPPSTVVFPFGGSHHTVPGVVAVNRAPYVCVAHARTFRERADFVTHLRIRHGLSDDEIPRSVLVGGGQVRYVGE